MNFFEVQNTSISQIRFKGGYPDRIITINDKSHIGHSGNKTQHTKVNTKIVSKL